MNIKDYPFITEWTTGVDKTSNNITGPIVDSKKTNLYGRRVK